MTAAKNYLRSFRLVCAPEQIPLVEALLEAEGFRSEPEPFSGLCRKLLAEPFPLGSSLAAFFGYIYIQDRSSMLPPLALAPENGSAVLDMAASPGSKSGFLAQLCGKSGFVLANEPNPARLATLRANLAQANLLQTSTCSEEGQKLQLEADSWPFILLDPPCSGWGTANPRALKLWQGKKIDSLISLQRKLLRKAASLLSPGGRLLYSTCTTNQAENEAQTAFAISELGLEPVAITPLPGFRYAESRNGCLLVDGAASKAQGFYLSLLARPASEKPEPASPEQRAYPLLDRDVIASPVCDPDKLPAGELALFGDRVFFLPAYAIRHLPAACKWQGFLLGKMTDRGFAPSQRLRALLPCFSATHAVRIDDIAIIRKLLCGQSLACGLKERRIGLWWQDLPLGICQIRNGRIIARFLKV